MMAEEFWVVPFAGACCGEMAHFTMHVGIPVIDEWSL